MSTIGAAMADDPPMIGRDPVASVEACGEPAPTEPPAKAAGHKPRGRRGPTPAELALLRWLAAKPRPVMVGPIGHCVKRGWCTPVRAVVEDYDGRRPGIVYVVTDAGFALLQQHGQPADGASATGPVPDTASPDPAARGAAPRG